MTGRAECVIARWFQRLTSLACFTQAAAHGHLYTPYISDCPVFYGVLRSVFSSCLVPTAWQIHSPLKRGEMKQGLGKRASRREKPSEMGKSERIMNRKKTAVTCDILLPLDSSACQIVNWLSLFALLLPVRLPPSGRPSF